MDADKYWKFCTLLERIDKNMARTVQARAQLLQEHGLDPAINGPVFCNDETFEVTQTPPESQKG